MSKALRRDWALEFAKNKSEMINIYICRVTDEEIFYESTGHRFPISSFGQCSSCKEFFHRNALRICEGVDKDSWPIEYEGTVCLECDSLEGSSKVIDSIELSGDDGGDY